MNRLRECGFVIRENIADVLKGAVTDGMVLLLLSAMYLVSGNGSFLGALHAMGFISAAALGFTLLCCVLSFTDESGGRR